MKEWQLQALFLAAMPLAALYVSFLWGLWQELYRPYGVDAGVLIALPFLITILLYAILSSTESEEAIPPLERGRK